MAIGYTELDFINGTAPALNAANMNHIDEGVKACADQLDALGNSATLNVGTGAGDVAAGNAPAGAVATHESTYAHANLPTADGKTAADAIGAATGATTALKLANLASPASTTQQGVITKVTNAAEVTTGTSANAITPATLKDSTPALNGIKFPATQVPSADANTLDDYEEGTFAQTISDGAGNNFTIDAASSYAVYTKIGRIIAFDLNLTWTSIGSAGTGTLSIAIPMFATNISANYRATVIFGYCNGVDTASKQLVGVIGPGSSVVTIFQLNDNALPDAVKANNQSATGSIRLSGTYIAA